MSDTIRWCFTEHIAPGEMGVWHMLGHDVADGVVIRANQPAYRYVIALAVIVCVIQCSLILWAYWDDLSWMWSGR